MIYRVQFFKGDDLLHSKEFDLGLDAAKQHATHMAKPYEATSSRILDARGKEVFTYTVPTSPQGS
jgi:hypothetical protein